MHDASTGTLELIFLPESGDALVVWPNGRAIRIRPDGSTVPSIPDQAGPFLKLGRLSDGLDEMRPLVPRAARDT